MQKFPITSILHTVGHSYCRKVGLDASWSSFHTIFHCCYTSGNRLTHIYKSFFRSQECWSLVLGDSISLLCDLEKCALHVTHHGVMILGSSKLLFHNLLLWSSS